MDLEASGTSDKDAFVDAAEEVDTTNGTARRQRKLVERLVVGVPDTTRKRPMIIPQGEGSKLEDIPYISDQINNRAGDLVKLHRFLYGRTGAYAEVKKHLRQFSGFPLAHGSPEYEKKKEALLKMESIGRDIICDCLGLSKIGGKESVVERVLDFLLRPSLEKVTSKLTTPVPRRSPSPSPSKKVSPSKSPKEPTETSSEEFSSEEIFVPEESDYESEKENRKTQKGRKKNEIGKKPRGRPRKVAEPATKSVQDKKRKELEQPDETSKEEPVILKKRAKLAPKKNVATASEKTDEEERAGPGKKKNGAKKTEANGPAPKVPTFGAKKKKTPAQKKQESSDNTSGQRDGETVENDADVDGFTNTDSDQVSGAQVTAKVREILEGADFDRMTTEMVIDQVKAAFPCVKVWNTIDLTNIIHGFLD